ncbi:MAG: hypothetical protein U5M51_09230 [Emticicia sp.]|nr:hypothetical protein [Emticicia sp.]
MHELLIRIDKKENAKDCEEIITIFESIQKSDRRKYGIFLYSKMWKIALEVEKVQLANLYAQTAIENLLELKKNSGNKGSLTQELRSLRL